MELRPLGRTERQVGVVGLGAWQLGGDWGDVEADEAFAVLEAAVDAGVSFIDTADVYGDGRSEQLIGSFLAGRGADSAAKIVVGTKMGRRVDQLPEHYTRDNFRRWIDRSRANLGMDTLDLVQLHCPPSAVYADDAVFNALDELVEDGLIASYGVSVETCGQALRAIARPAVSTVQIILNAFRLKPVDEVLPSARAAGVGIIARVPLASGLLSGKYDERTAFAANDHRNFNRHGESFDVGETFAGVPFDVGLEAVHALRRVVPQGVAMAQFALRWVIDQHGVSVVIPGARTAEQARANAAVADLPRVSEEQLATVHQVYDSLIRPHVHDRW